MMTLSSEMSPEDVARTRLEALRRQHRDLDDEIHRVAQDGVICPLTLGRMKKEKLRLKDQIARIEDEMLPDIIA